jgi:long-chain acyl-CoA synthetase
MARPAHQALVQGERSVTWGQLDAMVDRVAASLQRDGVQPQQAIAICAANSLEYVAVFLGALRAGVVVAPLAIQSQPAQLAAMVADSGARHLFVDAGVPAFDTAAQRIAMDGSAVPSLAQWLLPAGARPAAVAVQPGWAFNIIYSSGTTGTPKGIVQPHAMRWAHVARADNFGYGPDSVTLLATLAVLQHHAGVFLPDAGAGAARWC